jgi:hypothetical protein
LPTAAYAIQDATMTAVYRAINQKLRQKAKYSAAKILLFAKEHIHQLERAKMKICFIFF